MRIKYLSLLMAAFLLTAPPSVGKDRKEKDKTEQTAKKKKEKKSEEKSQDSKSNNKKSRKKKKQAEQPQKPTEEKPSVDRPGLFRVTKLKNEWFFHVPDSLVGRDFLTTTRFTATPSNSGKFGGEQVNEQMVYFEKVNEEQMLLRARLIINVADSTQAISRAIEISNENPIIGSFKIEEHKDGAYKIKVSPFFNQDNPALGLPQHAKTSYGLQAMLGDMSYVEDIKSFPLNTEVRLVKTFAAGPSATLPAARSTGKVTMGLNISFILLPKQPMMKRYYDPRVGYFADSYTSFTDEQQRVEGKKFVTRWRLEPRPEDVEKMRQGELVEPMKPIVYYIDPATPKQWRKYLIQGVNDWQKAFEKAGFKNAIIGKEWPENDSTMSMEDARYSCIRYLASPIENAYGPNVHDPRSGEILESHICWYHNVMSLVHDWYMVQASSIDEAARSMNFSEELMGQLIRFVSSHEVGHTLGLRHNFGASSTVPVDSLRDKAWVEAHGHTPSIMDYARFNYVAQPEDNIGHEGIFPRINEYDEWAIKWGYTYQPDAKDEDDDHRLMEEMTAKSQENPRLWWGDGEAYEGRLDPRCQTEDLGDDAMKASAYGIQNLKYEISRLDEWTKDNTKDLYGNDLNQMYQQIYGQMMRYCGHVARNIGGTRVTYRTKYQAGDKYEPQPLEKQKAALKFMDEQILHEPMWLRDMSYARRIAADPQKLTIGMGTNVITLLMNRLDYLNELYSPQAYLTDLTKLVFTEAYSGQKVSPYRMAIQNEMLSHLMRAHGNSNTSIQPAVLYTLRQLETLSKKAGQTASDLESRAHWQHIYDQIGRELVWK
ncbi:MAG: zinc-dependent metalloprotease [Bacteroidaceae bacterium]